MPWSSRRPYLHFTCGVISSWAASFYCNIDAVRMLYALHRIWFGEHCWISSNSLFIKYRILSKSSTKSLMDPCVSWNSIMEAYLFRLNFCRAMFFSRWEPYCDYLN